MTRSKRRTDVAVYAPLAGPLYGAAGIPGGAELQSLYIARALVGHGYRVAHVVLGAMPAGEHDGVTVIPIPEGYERRGIGRRRAVIDALLAADAKIYIQRTAGFETGVVGLFARATRRPFVFSSSSSSDFTRDRREAKLAGGSTDEWPTRLQYIVGLRLATRVVVQTEEQRALARSEWRVDSRVIPSFCGLARPEPAAREAFLWIGGLVGSKDPLVYLELARRIPEASFWMVISDRGDAWAHLAAEVRSRAATVANLRVMPAMGRSELLGLYSRAVAIVNTSRFEGFPNTFLESWARGTPALSLRVDPDRAIERQGLGTACRGSVDELVAAARILWTNRAKIDPEPLRAYIARFHDPSVVGAHWHKLVQSLLNR
jgi:hypothetical protein